MSKINQVVNHGYTTRVYITDNITAPFMAMIEPDADVNDYFRAWAVDREIFVMVDGPRVEVLHIH